MPVGIIYIVSHHDELDRYCGVLLLIVLVILIAVESPEIAVVSPVQFVK